MGLLPAGLTLRLQKNRFSTFFARCTMKKSLQSLSLVLAVLAWFATPNPAWAENFPADGSFSAGGFAPGAKFSVEFRGGTPVAILPLRSDDQSKSWQVCVRSWFVQDGKWMMSNQGLTDFARTSTVEGTNLVVALLPLTPAAPNGTIMTRHRFWGVPSGQNCTSYTGKIWLNQLQGPWWKNDANGIPSYEALVNTASKTSAWVPSNYQTDEPSR